MEANELINFIKQYKTPPQWVNDAREHHKTLKALVYGKNFKEVLINHIEKIEDKERAIARRKYSIDIRDLFARVLEPRNNIFFADGGDDYFNEDIPEVLKNEIKDLLQKFKHQSTIEDYLSTNLFRFSDIDPNGVVFMEYKTDEQGVITYPTYKSINTIQAYESDGILLKWILFKTEIIEPNIGTVIKWRYVDDKVDVVVIERNNTFIEQSRFVNEFNQVPAVILSPIQEVGSELRLSWLFYIEELSKKYARDRSVKTIYEFQKGFPKHWRYAMVCNSCRGSGQVDGNTCKKCNGKGHLMTGDVTDDIILPLPSDKDYDIVVAPNVSGFVSPDLETLKHMEESGKSLEDLIMYTMWGVEKERRSNNETATGRFIDTQPLVNKLHVFSDFVEIVHNKLANFAINLKITDLENAYKKTYGRRFIIESPDVLLEKYGKAKQGGATTVMLDKLHSEYISSKYKNDPKLRAIMIKKAQSEPYLHLTIEEVNNIFGNEQAQRKYLFKEFWEQAADKTKTAEALKQDFETWVSNRVINQINPTS